MNRRITAVVIRSMQNEKIERTVEFDTVVKMEHLAFYPYVFIFTAINTFRFELTVKFYH